MAENYDSYYDSLDNMNHTLSQSNKICSEPHLYLNGRIFWCKFELPKIDGKRRFKRFSLRTDNYYEARQMIMDMQKYIEKIHQLSRLYHQLKIEKRYAKDNNSTVAYDYVLSEDNDVELLKQIKSLYDDCSCDDLDKEIENYKYTTKTQITSIILSKSTPEQIRDPEYVKHIRICNDKDGDRIWKKCMFDVCDIKKTLKEVGEIIIQIQNVLSPQEVTSNQNQALLQTISQTVPMQTVSIMQSSALPHYTIRQIIDKIKEQKRKGSKYTSTRKVQDIESVLSGMDISINSDYNEINNQKTINAIELYIQNLSKLGTQALNRRIRSINELVKMANKLEPEYYKPFVIDLITENSTSAQKPKKTYLPFTKEDLIKIFNPEEKFFKKYPDIYFACLIAMVTGSRNNAATTLRYSDIIDDKDGIKCFDFKLDEVDEADEDNPNYDPIKKLKTQSTVRQLALHSRLIELGFLDYIYKYEKRNAKQFQNFIFRRTLTKNQTYNKHFMRPFFNYLKKLGIRNEEDEKNNRYYAFHSFRNTINNFLVDNKVDAGYINAIVGWSGKGTRETNYSTRSHAEIQNELEKLRYPFIDAALEQISKEILAKE